MQNVLLVLQLLIAVGLIGVILVQRTAQDGGGLMGGGGGTMGGMFTARGSANIITRTTAILATLFILNSLALGYLASSAHERGLAEKAAVEVPASAPVSAPAVPVPAEAPHDAAPQVPVAK